MADIWRNDEAVAFLRSNGFSGSYNDMLVLYLRDVLNLTGLTLNDLLKRYIDANGTTLITTEALFTDFGVGGVIPAEYTFARATVGSYYNSAGLLVKATSGTARFDHNPTTLASLGLLLETSGGNELTRSEEFDHADWNKTNITIAADDTTAPDGTSTADRTIENAGTGSKLLTRSSYDTVTSGDYVTVSFYAKQPTGGSFAIRYIRAILSGTSLNGNQTAAFSLVDGSTLSSGNDMIEARSEELPNDWWRFSFTVLASSNGDITLSHRTNSTFNLTQGSYTGDGVSGLYYWGYQSEVNQYASSYIPTVAAVGTRNADALSITGANFSGIWNATEGTIKVYGTTIHDYVGDYVSASDGTANERLTLSRDASDNFVGTIVDGGVSVFSETLAGNTDETYFIGALAYRANDSQIGLTGTEGDTDTSVTLPTVDRFTFGSPTGINFHLDKFMYFDTRKNNLDTLN